MREVAAKRARRRNHQALKRTRFSQNWPVRDFALLGYDATNEQLPNLLLSNPQTSRFLHRLTRTDAEKRATSDGSDVVAPPPPPTGTADFGGAESGVLEDASACADGVRRDFVTCWQKAADAEDLLADEGLSETVTTHVTLSTGPHGEGHAARCAGYAGRPWHR